MASVDADGLDNSAFGLADWNGQVVAGGYFTQAGQTPVHCIASWDGNQWSDIGGGLSFSGFGTPVVWAVAVHNGDLIAAGNFDLAGGVAAVNIARWDGSQWHPLGAGLPGSVAALAVYNGDLFAGGSFTTAGGAPADRIARWDGTSWSALGNGLDAAVSALAVHQGKLYAGGSFSNAGDGPALRIAAWDGAQWSAVGSGVNGAVTALVSYGNDLVAAGYFPEAGGNPALHVARWDGAAWYALGAGIDQYPQALAVYGNDLIAGGAFTMAGEAPADNIARWDGSAWSPLGSGTGPDVYALLPHGTGLFVAGRFRVAGDKSALRIARWEDPSAAEVIPAPSGPGDRSGSSLGVRLDPPAPNPFRESVGIGFALPQAVEVRVTLFDLAGRRVRVLADGPMTAGRHSVSWDGRDAQGREVAAGLYFVRVDGGDRCAIRRVIRER